MATSREKLEATLAELQAELADLGELDSMTRQRLQTTLGEIRTALARSPSDEHAPASVDEYATQSLAERLNDATRRLGKHSPGAIHHARRGDSRACRKWESRQRGLANSPNQPARASVVFIASGQPGDLMCTTRPLRVNLQH